MERGLEISRKLAPIVTRNLISTSKQQQQQSFAASSYSIKRPPLPGLPPEGPRRSILLQSSLQQQQAKQIGLNQSGFRPQPLKQSSPNSNSTSININNRFKNQFTTTTSQSTPATTTNNMPALGLGFGHKGPLMGMLGSKRPGHRSKTTATAAAAATFVRAFTNNGRVNVKRMQEVVVRQSVRYRKMFHDGTGSLKADAEHPGRVPRSMSTDKNASSDEKDLDWVTDGEEEVEVVMKNARPKNVKRMEVEEVTVEAAESVAEIREIILDLEKELPVVEETQPEAQVLQEPEPQPESQAVQEPELQHESRPVQEPEPQPELQATQSKVEAVQTPEIQPEPQAVQEPEPQPEVQAVQEPEPEPQPEVQAVQEPEPQPETQAVEEPEIQPTQQSTFSSHGPMIEVREDVEYAPEPIVAAAAIEEPTSNHVEVSEPEPAKTVEDIPQESAPPLEEETLETSKPADPLPEHESETLRLEEAAPENSEPATLSPEHASEASVSYHNSQPLTPAPAVVEENNNKESSTASESEHDTEDPVPAAAAAPPRQVDVVPEVDEKETPQRDVIPNDDDKVVSQADVVPEINQKETETDTPSEAGNRSRSASEVSLPPAYSPHAPQPVDQVNLSEGKVNPNSQPTIEALKAERIAAKTIVAKEVASPWMREGTDKTPVNHIESEIDAVKHSERGISDEPAAVEKGEEGAVEEEYLSGQLVSTPSRLLKLVLPIPAPSPANPNPAPLALLVHPHQPLSYLERLIQTELPHNDPTNLPRVTFRALDVGAAETVSGGTRKVTPAVLNKKGAETATPTRNDPQADDTQTLVRWSLSTEVGDFVRDASKGKSFTIDISNTPQSAGVHIKPIVISVPTFQDRTQYQRAELRKITARLANLESIKRECDRLAHQAAQRVAIGGFMGLVSWWALVYLLTFETSYGWDVMEPVTYLAGLSTVLGGYLWFLYHNREVSYRSVLSITVTKRQMKLYEERGFDIEVWEELIDDARRLRREVRGVAAEYDVLWDESKEVVGGQKVREVIEEKKSKLGQASKEKKIEEDDDDDNPAEIVSDKRRDKTG